MTCGACGRENDADALFCSACGAQLDAQQSDVETRKVVTVVFTDVVGSTALGERLDPESLRRVMWRYFDTMQATLQQHGGRVEKFIGDAVVAIFGVPVLHEDDALRAVRAAIEMHEALERLNESLVRDYGVRIATRTGINTGEVIVSDGASDQKLATGDAVNIAARLEQAAHAGEVLIGPSTRLLVGDAVLVEPHSAVAAKGKSQPLAAWKLVGLRPDLCPRRGPFPARSSVVSENSRSFATSSRTRCENRHANLPRSSGRPGSGSPASRRSSCAHSSSERQVVVGRCVAYGEGITYLPLADVVHEVAGADPEPTLMQIMSGLERGTIAAKLMPAQLA